MSKLAILAATIWIVLAGGANTASAADLHGVVKDAKGGVLPGVQVVLLTPQRAVVETASTDEKGAFKIGGLPDGQYIVSVRHPSFAEKLASVSLTGAAPTTIEIVLDLVALTEDITVTEDPVESRTPPN